ncbi:PQQ-like beta-propeller repeat protein [Actibacterium sp. D379-3]
MKFTQGVAIVGILGLLAACGPREVILEGERIDVRDSLSGADPAAAPAADVARAVPIRLPAPQTQADWPQKASNPQHLPTHAALGAAPVEIWNVNIGAGETSKYRISADPVVADGRIFTLDARSQVMAHSTAGAPLWSADLTPASEPNKDATGGGLAYGGGRLFATSGFGLLVALDPATGRQIWTQKTDAVITSAPTYRDGLVYVVSRDNSAWAIRAEDGRVQWQLPGTPSPSGMIGGAAPAVTDRLAIFPFGSSELVATLRKSGVRVWGAAVSGQRRGRVYSTITDITGDPVVDGDVIYVASQSGRTVAIKAAGGERLWTAEEGSYSPVLPVGGSVFLLSDEARLVRLDAATGDLIWAVDLPYFVKKKPKKFKSVHAHYGPVLAGGRLVVASDDGLIRFFAPEDGKLLGTTELRGGATSDPVIANGTLYLVTSNGQLHAFR